MDDNLIKTRQVFRETLSRYGEPGHFLDGLPDALGFDELKSIFNYGIATQKRAFGSNGIIYFDYLSNPDFNALATTSKNFEFATIFAGTILHMYRIFYTYMSDPEVLPEIGDKRNQKLSENVLESIRSKSENSFDFHHPLDKTRIVAAQNLALASCILILNHEIGHIANCHVHLLRKRFGIEVHEELPITFIEEKQGKLLRAMEWEADEYAGVTTYIFLNHFGKLFPSYPSLSIDYIISVSALMLLFYIHNQSNSDFESESLTHPSPFDRWVWMTQRIERHERSIAFKPDNNEILKGIKDVTGFWLRNRLLSKKHISNSDNALEKMKKHYEEARSEIQKIQKDLEQLQFQRDTAGEAWLTANNKEPKYFAGVALSEFKTILKGRTK